MKGGRADVWTERERGGAAGKPSLTRRFYLKCCVEDKQLFPAGLSECSGRQLSEEGGGERAYSLMPTEELRLFNATHSLIQTERKPHPLSTNVGRSSSMMCKVVHKHEASIHTHSAVTWFLPPPPPHRTEGPSQPRPGAQLPGPACLMGQRPGTQQTTHTHRCVSAVRAPRQGDGAEPACAAPEELSSPRAFISASSIVLLSTVGPSCQRDWRYVCMATRRPDAYVELSVYRGTSGNAV